MSIYNYPHSIIEFQQQFSTEESCEQYLFNVLWPNGFVCPQCQDTEFYKLNSRRAYKCKSNGHFTYLTSNTIMDRSKVPLLNWFWAAYLFTTETPGISAKQLQRQLGIKRYETIFNLLHKLRASMVNPFRDKINGIVEVDETYIGGPKEGGKRGRGTTKALIIVAVENRDHQAGRIRMRVISNASEKHVVPFIQDSIEKGNSIIVTDKFASYGSLRQYGYEHEAVLQNIEEKGKLSLIHIVISNLKTWLRGTYHGAVLPKHLQAYLNEYTFRFNRRFYPFAGFHTIL